MERIDATVSLRHAREETLLALGAASVQDEAEHRKLADEYMAQAVHEIQREPGLRRNWSQIVPIGSQF